MMPVNSCCCSGGTPCVATFTGASSSTYTAECPASAIWGVCPDPTTGTCGTLITSTTLTYTGGGSGIGWNNTNSMCIAGWTAKSATAGGAVASVYTINGSLIGLDNCLYWLLQFNYQTFLGQSNDILYVRKLTSTTDPPPGTYNYLVSRENAFGSPPASCLLASATSILVVS